MARTQLVFGAGSLDLNDGATYKLEPGVDVGARLKTYDEYPGLDGTVQQTNVSEAHLIDAYWPLKVQSSSRAGVRTAIAAINSVIDTCTNAAPQDLIYDGTTYSIVASPRIGWVEDEEFAYTFAAHVGLALNRTP